MAKSPNSDSISTGGPGGNSPPDLPTDKSPALVDGKTGEIIEKVVSGERRLHKATYATDKKNGGYLIRVIGPHANAFAGKIVPVVRKDDSEGEEHLLRVVWTGIDTGTDDNPGTGKPVALYTFQKRSVKPDTPLF